MKLSAGLAVLGWSIGGLAVPQLGIPPKSPSSTASKGLSPLGVALPSLAPDAQPATSYGYIKEAKVPNLPVQLGVVLPVDSNSTSADARRNPLQEHGPNHRGNWSPGFSINTDMDKLWPNTGKVVRQTFVITNTTGAPNGVNKPMMLVNGQFPGPALIANWGDWIEVTVVNKLQTNGTSIHWHGFRQWQSNIMDGAGGATECPIAPGDSKVYRFQAINHGTSWYHSHHSVQYGEGVVGPIIINGPSSANYDIDMGAVMLSDYYDQTAFQADWCAHRGGPPRASNFLVNGGNIAADYSSGKRTYFNFTANKRHLLRIVNHSLDALFKFSIDGHRLKVTHVDFVPINPYYTYELSVNLGQRYHVVVEANQPASNYFMRVRPAMDCVNIVNDGTGDANAVIVYDKSPNPGGRPTGTAWPHSNQCADEPITSLVPIVQQEVDSSNFQSIAKEEDVNGVVQYVPEFVFHWTLGAENVSQVLDWGNPILGQAAQGNLTFAKERNLRILTAKNAWTFWIIQNKFFVEHPMHLHGHDFCLLGQGNGIFNRATDMNKLNFKNPPRRDVATLVASGWTVIAFKTDNPGAWLMHCHIAWHAGEGLSLVFLERPDDIQTMYGSQCQGPNYKPICDNWNKFRQTAPYKQADSGLKKRTPEGIEYIDFKESKVIQMKERAYMRRHGIASMS